MRQRNVAPEDPRNFNTRGTKQWCRGKVGVKHKAEWKPAFSRHHLTDLVWAEKLTCKECLKELDQRRSSYTFGQLVRKAREIRGWTQDDLAGKMGSTAPYICRIESDLEGNPTVKTVAKFAHAMKATYRVSFLGMPIRVDGYEESSEWLRDAGWIG